MTETTQSQSGKEAFEIIPYPPTSGSNPYYQLLYSSDPTREFTLTTVKDLGDICYLPKISKRILHLHWLVSAYDNPSFLLSFKSALKFIITLLRIKKAGVKIVYTFHNVFPHQSRSRLIDWIVRFFVLRISDHVFIHTSYAKKYLNLYFLRFRKITFFLHGSYEGVYKDPIPKEAAKAELSIPLDKDVLLFFGSLQPYKGIENLIETFRSARIDNSMLVIAGKPESEKYRDILMALCQDSKDIVLHDFIVPTDSVHLYFSAADLLVLPYERILTSGTLLLAYTFHKPVIMPDFPELSDYLEPGLSITYIDELNSTRLIECCTKANFSISSQSQVNFSLDRYRWVIVSQSFWDTLINL